ncbi:MAG: amino acid permease [Candidatus Woesearchaeota archaeon]
MHKSHIIKKNKTEKGITRLKRSITLPLLTFYGLGTIIGAGIYVLVGEVGGKAGMFAPIAFLIAAIIAGLTAISYAELSARFPKSAAEAVFVFKAFRKKHFSLIIGLMVALTALISSATLLNGFNGYYQLFFQPPGWAVILVALLILGFIAIWGIKESAAAAAIITFIEVGGLIFITWAARDFIATLPSRIPEMIPSLNFTVHGTLGIWIGILMGSFIAFFAYIGVEDMINVAEEVKNPKKNMPLGVFFAVGASTILYILVAVVVVLALPPSQLAGNESPLASVYTASTGKAPIIIGLISLIAIVNGILIQIILASRIIYGLASNRWLPQIFDRLNLSYVNKTTRTPLVATLIVIAITLIFALWLPLITLAKLTSFIVLIVYSLVNLSLIIIKKRTPYVKDVKSYPAFIPYLGFIFSLALVLFQMLGMLGIV